MSNEESKPSPDALLESIEKQEQKAGRGQLWIFLGMCPGVGKTYAMLEAAHERKKNGSDVVIGIIETHGRAETQALVAGLEVLPKIKIEYREKNFEELDVDRVLARKPELVLVDELAHTNTPGSRHPKRYHDVNEIIQAGIDVYTTMNVQHLESRVDLIKQITGVTVQERVPDSFFELADQVKLVDLPPTELLKRLKAGKVYVGDMAEKAVEGFFQEEHLLALRELALRFTAEVVEGELHDQMVRKQISGPWQTRERMLVAISHSPYSKRLIRAARRTAASLEANWIALYVDTGEALSEEDKEMLRRNMDMASELGADVVSVRDTDIPSAIRRVAEQRNVTQILMGRPDRRFFSDLIGGGTILDKLVRETSEIDIHVLRQVRKPRHKGWRLRWHFPAPLGDLSVYSNAFWFIALVTAIGAALEPIIKYQAVGFIFLLAVLTIATLTSRGPTIFATVLSALTWNYFFIPPKFTFYIAQIADVMMNVAYFGVALGACILTTKIKRQSDELKSRAQQISLLYDFSRELANSSDIHSITAITYQFVKRTLGSPCSIFIRGTDSKLKEVEPEMGGIHLINDKHRAVAQWVSENGKRAGFGTETLSGSDVFCLPINGTKGIIGVFLFFPNEKKSLSFDEETLLESLCASVATSIERENLRAETESLHIVEASEKLYQTVLDSVSHELRTPITTIMGAASALQDQKTVLSQTSQQSLTEEIILGTQRLNHVVENLLDMSRMSSGQLTLQRELVELSETIDTIVAEWKSFKQIYSSVEIQTQEEVYSKIDIKLFRNVIYNLLHNALAYSPPNSKIVVRVSKNMKEGNAMIEVIDEGSGIVAAEGANVFQKFYRVPGTAAGGMGLGLSIVKGLVEAHGGTVRVANRQDRSGSIFQILVPMWNEEIPKA